MGTTHRLSTDGELAGLSLAEAAETTTLSGRELPSGCPYDWVRVESDTGEYVFRVRVRSAFESWEVQVPIGPGAEEDDYDSVWVQDPEGYEDEPLAAWVAEVLEAAGVRDSMEWGELTGEEVR